MSNASAKAGPGKAGGRSAVSGAGRPRLSSRKRPGATAREEILDASAELFTTRGFTSTSTRMIADAVGIRQASLYHHFGTKEDILAALLVGTVDSPLDYARVLAHECDDAPLRLYALTWFDAGQLASSRWNLGALYLMPELDTERFTTFRTQRIDLMDIYCDFARGAAHAIGVLDADAPGVTALPFRLVESVINIRSDIEAGVADSAVRISADAIADAALRVLGWTGPTADLAERTPGLLGDIAESLIST